MAKHSFAKKETRQKTWNRGREDGGVALYIHNDLVDLAEVVLNFSPGVIEMIGVKLKKQSAYCGHTQTARYKQ